MRPNRDIAFHVTNACFEAGRPELAVAYCREFDVNGLAPRPIMAKRVAEAEAQLHEDAPPQAGLSPAHGLSTLHLVYNPSGTYNCYSSWVLCIQYANTHAPWKMS